jgi:hypothetical protein
VTTHPVQYQAPWFRALAEEPDVELIVFYALIPDARQQGTGFGVDFLWDVPLLEGYRHEVMENRASRPAVNGFFSRSSLAAAALCGVLGHWQGERALLP